MSIDVQAIESQCEDLSNHVVREYLGRMPEDYLNRFATETVAQHVRGLSNLSAQQPVEVIVNDAGDQMVQVTVLAFDHLFEFSLIAYYNPGGGGYGGSEYVWRYKDSRARFNEAATTFRIHPGLKEVLGLKKFTRSS